MISLVMGFPLGFVQGNLLLRNPSDGNHTACPMGSFLATASVEKLFHSRGQRQFKLLENHLHLSVDQHMVLIPIHGQLHLHKMLECRALREDCCSSIHCELINI